VVVASAAIMGILHSDEFEIIFPVRALLLKGRGAVADLDPAGRLVGKQPRIVHVAEVLTLRYRAFAQRTAIDGFQ